VQKGERYSVEEKMWTHGQVNKPSSSFSTIIRNAVGSIRRIFSAGSSPWENDGGKTGGKRFCMKSAVCEEKSDITQTQKSNQNQYKECNCINECST
jgi:hypothetical protein